MPGDLTYTPSAGTILNAGSGQSLSVSFTAADTADYNTAVATVTINVARAVPTITWASPAAITYGTALSSTQLDASASVEGTFSYTPGAGAFVGAGSGQTLSVTFTPQDSVDYATATAMTTLTVKKAQSTLSLSDPGGHYDGSPFPASISITGVGTGMDILPAASMEGVTPTLT